jgi:hypothetical protein
MADPTVENGVKLRETALKQNSETRSAVRSAQFKYYIHDGVDCCRLQLIGDFTASELPDLAGCWDTVKTTLAARKLVLDLTGLRRADDDAKSWLIRMAAEGAILRPENYLRDGFALESSEPRPRVTVFSRLMSVFRRSCALEG